MKQVSVKRSPAPTPRLTIWVPVVVSGGLTLFWLGILALTQI